MALFSRIKASWTTNENVTNTDLDAEINNLIDHYAAAYVIGHSTNVAQMKEQTNPGALGTEVLAASVAEEIEAIRFVLARALGVDYWFQAPVKSLAAGQYELGFYLPFDGGDTTDAWSDSITRGAIPNALTQLAPDFTVASMSSAQKKFGNYSCVVGEIMGIPAPTTKRNVGTVAMHFRNYGNTQHLAYNPLLGIELYLDAAGVIQSKITKKTTASETAKATATIAGTGTISGSGTWKHAALKYALNGINGSGVDALGMNVDGVAHGTQLANQTIGVNVGDGGCWFFGASRNDPTWAKYSPMKVLPSSESSSPWTFTGQAAATTISSDGILSINTDGITNHQAYFSLTTNIESTSTTIEFKMRLTSAYAHGTGSTGTYDNAPFQVQMRDDSTNKSFSLDFFKDRLQFRYLLTGTAVIHRLPFDLHQWHVYRITCETGILRLYVDGVLILDSIIGGNDVTAGDMIQFGDLIGSASTGHTCSVEIEYFAYTGSEATPPVKVGTLGYLDDIAFITDYLNDSGIELGLTTSKAATVFGRDKPRGRFWKYAARCSLGTSMSTGSPSIGTSAVTWGGGAGGLVYDFPSDGITPITVQWEAEMSVDNAAAVMYFLMGFDTSGGSIVHDSYLTESSARLSGALLKKMKPGLVDGRSALVMTTKQVFPAGVVRMTPNFQVGDAAHVGTFYRDTNRMTLSYESGL